MSEQSKKMISDGVVIGKKVLSVAERILIELVEEIEDMQYMRTHCYAVLGRDVRSMRYESEEWERLHEEKEKRLHKERMEQQALKRLRKQKFIKARKEGDRVIYELTTNGKIRAIKIAIRHCCDYYPSDKTVCLVSYDFPEAAEDARTIFRRLLKSMGFKFVQGSVWSSNKNVVCHMKALVALIKISRWVEVYEGRQ